MENIKRPDWIRSKVSWSDNSNEVSSIIKNKGLHSVCREAMCPNKGECWEKKHVTFMILGDTCTRGCSFCNVISGEKGFHDEDEPQRVAEAVKELGAEYIVITSVTRDDLKDRGAGQFAKTVNAIKETSPEALVELLIPDMAADEELLMEVTSSGAEVIGHNIEMPKVLYPEIRPKACYETSLKTLNILSSLKSAKPDFLVKSAMIIGLGENREAISETLKDLYSCGVDIVYIGQYLNPTKEHWPIRKYYTSGEFLEIEEEALNMGFRAAMSGPMVRSSYLAREAYIKAMGKQSGRPEALG